MVDKKRGGWNVTKPTFHVPEEQEAEVFRQFFENHLSVPQDDDGLEPKPKPKRKKVFLRASMGPVFYTSNPIMDLPSYRHLRNFFRRFPFTNPD